MPTTPITPSTSRQLNLIGFGRFEHNGILPMRRRRQFGNTASLHARRRKITHQRALMLQWLRGPGAAFRVPRPGSTNYLSAYDKSGKLIRASEEGDQARQVDKMLEELDAKESEERGTQAEDHEQRTQQQPKNEKSSRSRKKIPPETLDDLQPFPLNPFFHSPPVLSLELRDEVCRRIIDRHQSIREVSQALGIEMDRVGAVVRLKRVEEGWTNEGKPLALNFRSQILNMLPRTPFDKNSKDSTRHESINNLPVHPSTLPQLFHPAPESAQFTRADAGRVFRAGLLPADDRIPHPDMIETAREEAAGITQAKRDELRRDRWEREEASVKARNEAFRKRKEKRETIVAGKRWDFKFVQVSADTTGTVRDPRGVGWRYGAPLPDRKKGAVRIPTHVD